MHSDLRQRWETSPTLVTREPFMRFRIGMHRCNVVSKAGRMRKLLLAVLTGVRPVLAVSPLMRLEIVDMCKALAASVTHQWLVVAVRR